ncbi:MAG TPA: hypothetical protein VGS80_01255 [Ktedonobacterales bacterium]|nr:hypothetical protein [Ktedonobacterales bacterium]
MPGFTLGLDWILVIGQLRLSQHLTLDQTHQVVQAQLSRWQVTLSRREGLYLFEAYCSLLRAAHAWSANPPGVRRWKPMVGCCWPLMASNPTRGTRRST